MDKSVLPDECEPYDEMDSLPDTEEEASPALTRPRLGVSACLLGQEVRFDGGHKRHRFITDTLAQYVDLVPVCPEVEMGLGIPRPTLRLVRDPTDGPRLVELKTGTDHTRGMRDWAMNRAHELSQDHLNGFILKKDSPSCGVARVRHYDSHEKGARAERDTRGLFAHALDQRLPSLPLTEEGWLNDGPLRESFLNRAYTHWRFMKAFEEPGHAPLVKLQTSHKFLFMAHSPPGQTELGRIVANAEKLPLEQVRARYLLKAMQVLGRRTTRGRHSNVLQHILGFFKDRLSNKEKVDALRVIDEYRTGVQPLFGPLMLLNHLLTRYDLSDWLASQVYFEPYPRPLVRQT